jgi:Icc-related predicted phosphoesterase
MTNSIKKTKIAAMADIHVGINSQNTFKDIFLDISDTADVLVLCGDLTYSGQIEEAKVLANELTNCRIPVVAVLGNHDYDVGNQQEIRDAIINENVTVLDGDHITIGDIGFAGTIGFAGGFDKYMLNSFGEPPIKQFVQEAVNEQLKLERALSQIEVEKKVVLLHYAPIRHTVVGEPTEIWPFLGSSRLLEPIENYEVQTVFHGHAHLGTYEGVTPKGTPVYNVAMPIMQKLNEKQPYAIIEI